jgi:hypothetical protein
MRRMRFGGPLLGVLWLAASPAWAQSETTDADADDRALDTTVHADTATTTISPVVVSGAQPGPRLWKVSRDGHVMWVLGGLSPLPKDMQWAPGRTAARLREARVVLRAPTVKLDADVGFFGGLMLLPSAMAARKNPEGKTLAQVLPPAVYARWLPLKQRYLGNDRGVEKFRPVFAAGELWAAALKRNGLTTHDPVWERIGEVVEETKPDVRRPVVTVKLEDPRKMIKQFRGTVLDDTACFERTLARLETDVGAMRQRANAWAIGDIDALRALPHVDAAQACQDAFFNAALVKERGMGDLDARAEAAWLVEAEKALRETSVSFATLPIRELLDADGYLAKLRQRGYQVQMAD